ncbi:MAG: enoyl-CoA hydratase/isomerase family protein [Dehalococcoidia bacterium]|jgi:2-(1,2-epoxy-1,2-dihydrophenyl)acetyl-CoA isomerase|nr:enoyl-CoA hydratase/isomerase family protein [Dehalococcoidia bacterium]
MNYNTVILTKEEGVATLTLNRPEKLNAWNEEMSREALQAVEEIRRDSEARVLVVTGAGRGFSSGADLTAMAQREQGLPTERVTLSTLPGVVALAYELRNLDRPTIAAVNGVAAGAGFGIALACDIRIASDQARFSQIFVKRALVPDTGSTYFLTKLLGTAKACELMFTGDFVDAAEAERLGIVNKVVPHDELMNETMALAKKIASGPPLTIELIKRAIYKGFAETDLEHQLNFEMYLQRLAFATEDFKEGVTAFLEKREPKFQGK